MNPRELEATVSDDGWEVRRIRAQIYQAIRGCPPHVIAFFVGAVTFWLPDVVVHLKAEKALKVAQLYWHDGTCPTTNPSPSN
jgi:hypothetical protein